ncbi:hypothetical protein [Algivirga pacifica]|uniref:Major capsid protein n=1 Tax=Algivirga pacifica TaxID=1162670 RepID=A0ABP9D465_9BACT
MAVHKEIWIREVEKAMRATPSFLSEVPDRSALVGNKVIHLTELGADPQVLIDNTVYPIATSTSADTDVTIVLKKLDTTNTEVTDDELHAISYDKIREKTQQHADTLSEKIGALGLHSLAPAADGAFTPVVEATGADDGTGRNRLTPQDLATLKLKCDNMKIGTMGRILVLSPAHVNDLLMVDQSFKDQYYNLQTGRVLNLCGFKIYEFAEPVYYDAANAKKSFGAVPGATDRISSIFFYAPKTLKAQGDGQGSAKTKMYFRDSKIDPERRSSVVGFRTYFMCVPKTGKYIGAIVSPQA